MAADRDAYEVLQVDPKAHAVVLKAAHRALASLYHPDLDQSDSSTRRMAEVNQAWERVRTPDRREVYDRQRAKAREPAPAAPIVTPQPTGRPAPRRVDTASATLDFGRYQGWTLAQLAQEDSDYLRWLSRHSSGIRYRSEIERLLRDQSVKRETGKRR
jgi:curved DNA-binding protein CbpA